MSPRGPATSARLTPPRPSLHTRRQDHAGRIHARRCKEANEHGARVSLPGPGQPEHRHGRGSGPVRRRPRGLRRRRRGALPKALRLDVGGRRGATDADGERAAGPDGRLGGGRARAGGRVRCRDQGCRLRRRPLARRIFGAGLRRRARCRPGGAALTPARRGDAGRRAARHGRDVGHSRARHGRGALRVHRGGRRRDRLARQRQRARPDRHLRPCRRRRSRGDAGQGAGRQAGDHARRLRALPLRLDGAGRRRDEGGAGG